ncbi:MAG TPA: RDD family protein [Candidatus Acidoferrum sp.]|nr:RDD family protein [Candidatus Acidoferrum sp.]
MQPPDASDDLVVATPERVAFQYEIAGIGSRFLAQFVDVLIISVIQIVITIGAAALAGLFNAGELAALIELILSFVLIAGYFLISEAAWNGQTVGKRVVRLRVVGDHGEPLTIAQAVIRNLIRVVDFLPVLYAVGILTMFSNRRAKRLGDFAAGTLVVRDRERISLYDLGGTAANAPAAAPPPATSIWATPETAGEPAAAPAPTSPVARPMDPNLRRLVVAYAARRESLPMYRREALAKNAENALRVALPDVVAASGPLAALDSLAEREGISPHRPEHRNAGRAMTWGVLTLVFCWFPIISIPTGILSIVFAGSGLRAIRAEPDKYRGEDRAKTGRLLGIIGLVIAILVLGLFVIGFVFRSS